MSLKIEKPTTNPNYWKPLLVVLVIAAVWVLWPRFAPAPSTPLAFVIAGFEGDVSIYDLESRSWRVPKRGEEFKASQRLKTGADGIINFKVDNEIMLRLKENSELENKESRLVGSQEVYKLFLDQGVLFGVTAKPFDRKQAMRKAVFQIVAPDFIASVHGAIFRIQATSSKEPVNKVGVLRGSVEVKTPSLLNFKEGLLIRAHERVNVIDGAVQPVTKISREEWGLMKESYELIERTAGTEAVQMDLSKKAGNFFNYVFDHGSFYTPKIGYAGREFYKDPDTGDVYLETEYDVFPTNSVSGAYFKVRNFDASKFSGLSLEVCRKSDEGAPDSFSIELKSKGNVLRRYAPRGFKNSWQVMQFDFHAKKTMFLDEIVFCFMNVRVGEAKKGILEIRHINLTPLPPPSQNPPMRAAPQNVAKKPVALIPPASPKPVPQHITAAPSKKAIPVIPIMSLQSLEQKVVSPAAAKSSTEKSEAEKRSTSTKAPQ